MFMSPKNALQRGRGRRGRGCHSIIISKMAGFASTLPNQRSSVRCKPQTLHLRGLIQFSFFFFFFLFFNNLFLYLFYLFYFINKNFNKKIVGIIIYCILCVVMEGAKSVYKCKRERERKCVITLGRHNTLHEPRLKISTEHACSL